MQEYRQFIESKVGILQSTGVVADREMLPAGLFEFQKDLTIWGLRKGRAAIFADTGLGKTIMQLAWAQAAGERALILAPLAVGKQTVAEARDKWGLSGIRYAKDQSEMLESGITVTNYERADRFDARKFQAVVLDESSILKSFDGKIRTSLINQFADVPHRLCCTATPAPNDISEIANHAEFLGVMTRTEMLAAYFVHDDAGWRLKGHAAEAFYRWMATWSMSLKRPSDLGYSDDGYNLPPLNIESHVINTGYAPAGMLFPAKLKGIGDRSAIRKDTVVERVNLTVELIKNTPGQWIAWCGLNDESDMLAELLGADCVHVYGSQDAEEKESLITKFSSGAARVLVTKPKIAGMGLNFQNCHNMAFVGISDSYETYYQSIRRCWRFGQQHQVNAHIVLSDPEAEVYANVLRKEREAEEMSKRLVANLAGFEKEEIGGSRHVSSYKTDEASGESWRLMLGDSCERLLEIEPHSIDLSVFSPPFQSLYTYSPSERDLGNSTPQQFWKHFGFIAEGLLSAMRPGRNVCVHVGQLATTKATHGVIGLDDFRGATIRMFQSYGFVYHGEVCIDKDPQAQAIRTHSKGLLFVQLKRDAAWLRPALADYILVFRAPGENAVPVIADIDNEQWIEWARPIWYGIRETETLNVVEARSDKDERHICPLQLGTIERCVRLWSNRGETVLSPFAGIGSEGYQSVLLGRRFVGIELKPEYFKVAVSNLKEAQRKATMERLF